MRRAGNGCRNFEHRSRFDFLFLCLFLFLWLFHFLFLFSTKHVRDDFMALDFIYYQRGIILTKWTLLVFIVAKKYLLILWKLDCVWNRVLFLSHVLYFPLLRLSSNWRTLWRKSVKLQVVGLSSLSILTTWSFHHLHFISRYFSTKYSCAQRKTMLTLAWILPTTWRTWKRTWTCTRW